VTATLKELLPDGVLAPGIWDALSARLAERAGFSCLLQGGFQLEATMVGAPDLGLMTASEVITQASNILAATTLPLIVDIDTGFGGVNNIWRTVRGLEMVGVSAVHIEDQTSPKHCPSIAAKSLQSREQAVLRVQAALDARRSDDFLVIARTDADGSFAELVERSNLYLEAGADVAMPMLMSVDGVPIAALSPDEQMDSFAKLAAEIDGYVYWNNRQVPVGYTAHDLISAGFNVVGFPIDGLRVSAAAIQRLFASIAEHGTAVPYYEDRPEDVMGAAEFATKLLALTEFTEREEKFTWTAPA
jgi:2-methylisocitrate lyase-like PEP mutase family enzyme